MAAAPPPDLTQQQANLCLTREDIIGDAGKPSGGTTTDHNSPLFQASLNSLVATPQCTGLNLLEGFDSVIQSHIDQYAVRGHSIYKFNIPSNLFATRKKKERDGLETLVRITTDMTVLQDQCAPFFFVKDNYGFKNIEEKFCLASFYDEGGRRITTGGRNLREYLSTIYPSRTTYTINLYDTGMTIIENSSLTAHWDARGGGYRALTAHEILFTLCIGVTDYVQCVFTYIPNLGADGVVSYTNSTKTPISCSFISTGPLFTDAFINAFIVACFSGNGLKNLWFNTYSGNIKIQIYTKCGRFIQLGKAIGDASFVFSKSGFAQDQVKRFSVGTNDKALALRCCINDVDAIFVFSRGTGACERYYMTMQHAEYRVGMSLLQPSIKSKEKPLKLEKKTAATENFKRKVGIGKVCKKANGKVKDKLILSIRLEQRGRLNRVGDGPARGTRSITGRTGRAGRVTNGGEGEREGEGKEVKVIWGKEEETVVINNEYTIGNFKEFLTNRWGTGDDVTKRTTFIIDRKVFKNDNDNDKIPADTKKIMIIGTKPNIKQESKKGEENANTPATTTDSIVSTNTNDDSIDPNLTFINYNSEFLKHMLDFLNDSLANFSELRNTLSSLIEDSTIKYGDIPYMINKDTFNLNVKHLCISKVIEFLTLFVKNISDENLRIKLLQIIADKIVKKEDIFDIKKVLDNLSSCDTLVIPVPDGTEKLCGIPTTQLFEGCEKLLSYLVVEDEDVDVDGVKEFPKDFFKSIHDEIKKLNKELVENNSTRKEYTTYTIFSDLDSKPITELSLKKFTDKESSPPHIHLLESLQKKLTELKNNPQHDLTDSQEESQKEYIKKIQEILNDITRILDESSKLQKYKVYNEISKVLTKLLIIIEYSDLVLMIISSFIRDELIAIVIRNELSRFISIRGTFIFDIKIIEAFIDGLDVDETMGSIIYKRGYDAIDTLINVKQYFDGDVIDALNEEGFSLMEIGDFMDELISQITEQELTDDAGIETLITSQIDLIFPKLEQQEQIRQPLDPLGLRKITESTQFKHTGEIGTRGGKNNRIYNPKHNTKYRKNYKKFVSKYIIKKKRNKNKNNKNNKNNNKKNKKNKTRKNKRLTKSTSNSKRNSKTLKNKKGKSKSKSKSGNHKSKYNNKTKTNYYNYYKHNKTLKH